MSHYHGVVWIDHHEARIFELNEEEVDKEVIKAPKQVRHNHNKDGSMSTWRAKFDKQFHEAIAKELGGVQELLIVGPANAKLGLMKYLHDHARPLADKVVGIETVDHPSDKQLISYARNYFKHADRMLPQLP